MARYGKTNSLDDPISQDGDTKFLRVNTRTRPSDLQPGDVTVSRNGRMDTDLGWRQRDGVQVVSASLLSAGEAPIVQEEDANAALFLFDDVTISAATGDHTTPGSGTGTVTATVSSLNTAAGGTWPTGHTVFGDISGFATELGGDPNGGRVITRVSDTSVTFECDMTSSGSYTISGDELLKTFDLDPNVSTIYASGVFSDPNSAKKEWAVIATNSQAVAYDLSADDVAASRQILPYPGTETVSGNASVIQAFDRLYILREGERAMEWNNSGVVFPGVPTAFTLVANSPTQHTVLQTDNNTDISGGVATITENFTALGSEGDAIWLTIIESPDITFPEGKYFRAVIGAGETSATYYIQAADITDATVVYSTESSIGGGYISMPASGWGTYFQRRMWLPYDYDGGPGYAARNVFDEVIASDILDPDVYDPLSNQFRVTAGIADYLVALEPFADDYLVAFNRNSIHLLSGVSGALVDVVTTQLSNDVGCVARKSVTQYGPNIFFLSDSGFYSIGFLDERNLRGAELPLSEAIQPTFDRINKEAASLSVATYHNNRIYLAIPLDTAPAPNTILVYNLLNQGWESEDTLNTSNGWRILDFLIAQGDEVNDIYAVNTTGGIHKLDELPGTYDIVYETQGATTATVASIDSELTTRLYTHGTIERKRYHSWDLHLKTEGTAGNGNILVNSEDPDSTTEVGSVLDILGNVIDADSDASLRFRSGSQRGFGASMTFRPTLGQPVVRAIRTQASQAYRATESAT